MKRFQIVAVVPVKHFQILFVRFIKLMNALALQEQTAKQQYTPPIHFCASHNIEGMCFLFCLARMKFMFDLICVLCDLFDIFWVYSLVWFFFVFLFCSNLPEGCAWLSKKVYDCDVI